MKPLKLVLSLLQSICTDNLGQQGSSRLTRKPLHRSRRSETSSPVQSHPRKNKMGLTTSTKQNLSMTRTSERKYDCKFFLCKNKNYFTWIMMKIVFLVLSLFQCYYWLKYMYAISIIFLQSKHRVHLRTIYLNCLLCCSEDVLRESMIS